MAREAPHRLNEFNGDFLSRNPPILKTQQSHLQTYLTLNACVIIFCLPRIPLWQPLGGFAPRELLPTGRAQKCPPKNWSRWVPEGSLAGICWARFSRDFWPEPTPGTPPLDRRGPPRTSISTRNQRTKNPARLPSCTQPKTGPEIGPNIGLITPGFLIPDFLTDRKSSNFGVWAAPGGRETFQKGGGGEAPYLFGRL